MSKQEDSSSETPETPRTILASEGWEGFKKLIAAEQFKEWRRLARKEGYNIRYLPTIRHPHVGVGKTQTRPWDATLIVERPLGQAPLTFRVRTEKEEDALPKVSTMALEAIKALNAPEDPRNAETSQAANGSDS